MQRHTIQVGFFLTLLAMALSASFFVFKPFLAVVFLASVLAVSFYPLYEFFVKKIGKGHTHLSALLTVLVILFAILVPLGLLSVILVKDTVSLYNSIVIGDGASRFVESINGVVESVETFLTGYSIQTDISIDSYTRNLLLWLINHVDNLFVVISSGLLNFVLMLMALYYMLINVKSIKKILLLWSPLPDQYDENFISELKISFDAVFKGRILVSLVQGLFMLIGFMLFGLPNAVLWGFVTAIVALIPVIGTAIVTIPAVAFLFLAGSFWKAIGLLLWGAFAVGMVDNIFSFYFFKGKISVHPLIILFAVLGGVELFGVIGYLVGPVVLSALVALSRIYPFVMKEPSQGS